MHTIYTCSGYWILEDLVVKMHSTHNLHFQSLCSSCPSLKHICHISSFSYLQMLHLFKGNTFQTVFQLAMQQRWWRRPLSWASGGAGRWRGFGRCNITPSVVTWPLRGTCWPGAGEWWSMKCHKGLSGEKLGTIQLANRDL